MAGPDVENELLITVRLNLTLGNNNKYKNNSYNEYNDVMKGGEVDPTMGTEELQSFHDALFTHTQPFTIILIVIYILNFVVGLVGNVFVILVILRHRHMRTLTNVFFVNLTIGDLMVVCICLPITLGNYVYKNWVYGQVMCKLTPFLQGTAVGVSVLSMMSISINRYFAIHKPLQAKIVFSGGKVGVMLVAIWLTSVTAVSPFLFINSVTSWGVPGMFLAHVCEEKWGIVEARQLYNILIFLVLFVLPLIIMALLYTRISMTLFTDDTHLFATTATGKPVVNGSASRLLKQRRKTVRSLILLVVLFGVSWLPYYVVNIWLDFNTRSDSTYNVLNFIYPLVQVNYCFDFGESFV
ncbi:hypothetical protein V1264_017185 [Littorina saxatilis]|uniref:G-protein coupled receptors family 1 profile domain-containing protein n=1 Tax=Littorina saxatilis TaxID=31220 RepID=A0AAN9GGG4_9CAEN